MSNQLTQRINQINTWQDKLAGALPENVTKERFISVLKTAVSNAPALSKVPIGALFNAAAKCAADGLLPDGREAALVPYKGSVNYLPMVHGIKKRLYATGKVREMIAEAVFEHDFFEFESNEGGTTYHFSRPLKGVRGDFIGAFCSIKMTNGGHVFGYMSKDEIDKHRKASSVKSGGPWKDWYDRMAIKTVVHRTAKDAPFSAEELAPLMREEEYMTYRQQAEKDAPQSLAERFNPPPEHDELTGEIIDAEELPQEQEQGE